ncbi:ATP-binding protein [Lentibacillus cibarius]|nr:ATP-binding protein [Lentibacillus cibarius]
MQKVNEPIQKLGGRIKQVGTRECERCGASVPVFVRKDKEGNTHQESTCLDCETNKTRSQTPVKEDVQKEKVNDFAINNERIPEKLIGKTVSELIPENESETAMKESVTDYIMNFGKTEHNSLVLAGAMGLGKSHLAYAAGIELRRQGFITMFINTNDFLDLIKSTFGGKTVLSERKIFEKIGQIDLLIFDEIGGEYDKNKNGFESWASEKILKVADSRETLPTIYTTNYSPAGFEKKYGNIQGGRIVSRMFAGAKRINVEGRDRRVQQF